MRLCNSLGSLLCVQHLRGLEQETCFHTVHGKTLLIVPALMLWALAARTCRVLIANSEWAGIWDGI